MVSKYETHLAVCASDLILRGLSDHVGRRNHPHRNNAATDTRVNAETPEISTWAESAVKKTKRLLHCNKYQHARMKDRTRIQPLVSITCCIRLAATANMQQRNRTLYSEHASAPRSSS